MGRPEIPYVFYTFLEAYIYGDFDRTENGVKIVFLTLRPESVENTPESRGLETIF